MAKTYTTLTSVSTGDVLTATNYNNLQTNSNNYRVPPAIQVRRTSNLTSYVSDATITWQSTGYDTESTGSSPSDPMWSSGTNPDRVTIKTAGLYLVVFKGYLTATATLSLVQPSIRKNGTSVCDTYATIYASANGLWSQSVVLSLAATDYLTASVFISGGSAYIIGGTASEGNTQTTLTATWVGQAS